MSGTALFGIGAAANDHSGLALRSAFAKANALVQLNATSATTTAEPASPADGDVYLLGSTHTGTNWAGASNYQVAHYYDSAWHFYTPVEGWMGYARDSDMVYIYSGSAWVRLSHLSSAIPGFQARVGSQIANATGDGTSYQVVFGTEDADTGGVYDASTGLFTAPVTGYYIFSTCVIFDNVASAHIVDIALNGGGINSDCFYGLPYSISSSGLVAFGATLVRYLTAAQTMRVLANVSGGSKVVDINAGSVFSGALLT